MRYFSTLLLSLFSLLALANEPATVIPFTIKNGHMFIQLQINDSGPLHFVFDTGAAANLMTEQTAEALNIKTSGSQSVQGASGSTRVTSSSGNSVVLQDIEMEDLNFLVLNIDHLSDEDTPLNGIIGASILNNFIVEIDYDQSEIRLYDQFDFEALDDDWHKELFSLRPFNIPVILASITLPSGKKHKGSYLVDTGAATSVKFNTPFVNDKELIEQMGDHYSYTSQALKHEATDEVSKLTAYEAFGQTFEDFAVRLSQVTTGVSSFSQVDGILGIDILRRFNTIYNYKAQAMYVKPNSHMNDDFPLNHDGLKVEKAGGAFKVVSVFDNSAATVAGIKLDDLIVSLDGRADFTRLSFHRYMQNTKGSVAVVLKRNGKELKVTLTPKPML